MTPLSVPVTRLPGTEDLPLPAYQTAGSSGLDLVAAVAAPLEIPPGGFARVPTGIAVAIPPGHEGQIRSRSGLALSHGVFVLNSPGTVDADYRGEIGVILGNLGPGPFRVERGARVAQLVVSGVVRIEWREAGPLPGSARGTGGFGSTGR